MSLTQLQQRHSVRKYTSQPLDETCVNALRAAITDINTHEAGMRFQLITDDPEPFRGFGRSYGFFSGVRNYIAAVVDTSYTNYRERAGFFGMQLVMKACALGLGTCFVSGTYSASHTGARVRVGEELLFLITVGHEDTHAKAGLIASLATRIIHRKHIDAESLLESDIPLKTLYEDIPSLPEALQALACAPSAMNKRPTRLHITRQGHDYEIKASVAAGNPAYEIDLGIALYSISDILPGAWDWGNPATLLRY